MRPLLTLRPEKESSRISARSPSAATDSLGTHLFKKLCFDYNLPKLGFGKEENSTLRYETEFHMQLRSQTGVWERAKRAKTSDLRRLTSNL